jgi:hypothetical protein
LIGGEVAAGNAGSVELERATKLAGEQTNALSSEAQTLVAADATGVRNPTSLSETATLVQSAPRGKSSRPWLAAAVLVVFIVGGAGAFYAYRRRQTQQVAAPIQNNPVQTPASNQPADSTQSNSAETEPGKTTETKIEKKVESTQRATTARQPADKTGSSPPAKDEAPVTPHDSDRDPNRDPNQGPPPQGPPPRDPRFDPFRNPRGPGHPSNTDGMPNIKTLPNGTRILTQPDGTRIITGPRGRVQVVPPGEKPQRKRDRP